MQIFKLRTIGILPSIRSLRGREELRILAFSSLRWRHYRSSGVDAGSRRRAVFRGCGHCWPACGRLPRRARASHEPLDAEVTCEPLAAHLRCTSLCAQLTAEVSASGRGGSQPTHCCGPSLVTINRRASHARRVPDTC